MTQQRSPYDLPEVGTLSIGILGGTGDQGKGLARRFGLAGHKVIIGSRNAERAQEAAASLGLGETASGADNATVATTADVVIDCVNPMGFDKQGAYALPVEEGSAAQQAAAVLPDSRVVAAFHHVSAVLLLDPEVAEVDLDVLVLGEDREATDLVQALAGRIPGMRGVYGGRLRNAHQVEALTANLISINRRYKAHAGFRVTDVG